MSHSIKLEIVFLQKLCRKKTFYLYKFFAGIPLSHNGSQQNDNKYHNKLFSWLSNEGVLNWHNRERHGSILFPDSMSTSIKNFLNITFDKIRNSFFCKNFLEKIKNFLPLKVLHGYSKLFHKLLTIIPRIGVTYLERNQDNLGQLFPDKAPPYSYARKMFVRIFCEFQLKVSLLK